LPYFPPVDRRKITAMTCSLTWILRLLCLAALALGPSVASPTLAFADDPTYPTGSRIGLAPPPGMVVSKNFFGFEDADNNAGIVLVALPAEAYPDLEKSMTADGLRRQGAKLESREALTLPTGKAFLVIGSQEADKVKFRKWLLVASSPQLTALVTAQIPDTAKARYPDAAVRAALKSVVMRAEVPAAEQLALLPFHVGDLANFKVIGVVPGRALMLGDAAPEPAPPTGATIEPHIFIAVAPGGPGQTSERDTFSRDVFATIPNIRDVRITSAEPLRVGGMNGYQIMADAKDPSGATPLTVVQWLRFGGGGYIQMVGVSRVDTWKDAYPRFRSVRDGIETK
jgi:hypothetical protein